MAEFVVRLCSQEGRDDAGRLQSLQWADLPPEVAGAYLSGGLKKVRRMTERYFGFRFADAGRRVRSRWRAGEPQLRLQFFHVPGVHGRLLLHLGRLRSTGTRDVYRGYHHIRCGEMVSPAAVAARHPWPGDMPWVAPSAGEFIHNERDATSYLGIFEIRVERRSRGCRLITALVDFPPVERGLRARLFKEPWQPLRQGSNLAFLRAEIAATGRELGHVVGFELEERPGTPARLLFQFGERQTTAV